MKLDEKQKAWIVTQYACYRRGDEILRAFIEQFGFSIPGNQARKYDCNGVRDDAHAKAKGVLKWMPLFREVRKNFNDSVTDIPIANAAYRIKKIDEMFEIAFAKRNYRTAAQLLEQAAKETGGAYSNKRVHEGELNHKHAVEDVPDDVKRGTLAQRFREAIEDAMVKAAATTEQANAAGSVTQH